MKSALASVALGKGRTKSTQNSNYQSCVCRGAERNSALKKIVPAVSCDSNNLIRCPILCATVIGTLTLAS